MTKPGSLRSWFLTILLSVEAALILAGLALMHRTWTSQHEQVRAELQRTVGTLGASIERSLKERSGQLTALALHLPTEEDAAVAELQNRAYLLLQQQAGWTSMSLNDGTGGLLWNSNLGAGASRAPPVVREHDQMVLRTGRPYVSDVFEGRASRRKFVAVAVPVDIGGRRLVLAGTLDLPLLAQWFDGTRMQGPSVGGLLDRQLRFVTRTSRPDELAGQPPSPDWARAIRQSPQQGVIKLRTLEGVESYSAWVRLPDIGWTVGIAVPAEPLERDLYRYIVTFIAWAVVVLLTGGGLIFLLGGRLLRDLQDLRARAVSIGQGLPTSRQFAIRDFDSIGVAMKEADARLIDASEKVQRQIQVGQAALEEAQRRLNELDAVLQAVPVPIFIARDAACAVVDGNPAAYRLLGVPPGTNLSQDNPSALEGQCLLIDGAPAALDESMRRAAAGQPVESIRFSLRSNDGHVRQLLGNATPVRDAADVPAGAVGAFMDITEQLTIQEELARSRLELQTIADHSPDVIVRFDRALRHVYVNAAIERISGLAPGQIIGRTNRELGMDPALCDRWDAMLLAVFDTGEPQRVEFSFVNVQGQTREFLGRFVPEFDAQGQVVHALGVVHDQTAEVLHARALASDAERRSRFIANFAHELRSPLSTLRVGLQVLRMSPGSVDPRASATMQAMERQVNQIVRLLDDLLEASRASAGKLRIEPGRVVLQEVISDALMNLSAADHPLTVNAPAEPVVVQGDAMRLHQVLTNLIGNSIKYSPAGGEIAIELSVDGDRARIIVRDHGLGIPTDKLQTVFEPFAQIDQHREHAQGGLGLGLAIVKQIVELHGGRITAYSDGLQGTEMVVDLPLAS